MKLLCSRTYAENRQAESSALQEPEDAAALVLEQDDRADEELATKKLESKTKQQAWNRERTQRLGTDPKDVRATLRAELEPGFLYFHCWKDEHPNATPAGTILYVARDGLYACTAKYFSVRHCVQVVR